MMKKILIASSLPILLTLSGCAGRLAKPDQEQRQNTVAQQIPGQPAADPRYTPESLSARLDDIEAKLAAMNDKLNATQQAMDNFVAAHEPRATGVPMQAADTVGIPVTANALPGAASGFVHDDAVVQYRKASILLQTQRYAEAIQAFSAFLANHPDHPLAGSAQFHVGEAYFRQKQFLRADEEFQKVLTSYDRSPHVSDTLRLMAEAEDSLGKTEAAARHRQLLTSLFASSPAAAQVASDRAQPQTQAQAQSPSQNSAQGDDSGIPVNPVTQLAKPGLDGPPPTANMNE